RMVDGIDRYAIDGNVGRTELAVLPMFATILGFEQSATPDRPHVHAARIPRVEGYPSRSIACQSLGTAIVPVPTPILRCQEPVAVPANKVCPLFASDRMLVTLGEPMRTNERPPLVLLRTPWRSLPTYTILLSSGSTSMALTLESALMGFQVVPALVDLKAPCPVEPA